MTRFLREPRPPPPAVSPWADRALLGIVGVWALLETVLRDELILLPAVLFFAAVLLGALALRRRHPLVSLVVAVGAGHLTSLAAYVAGQRFVDPSFSVATLVLVYTVVRCGSGKEAAAGLALMVAAYAGSALSGDLAGVEELIGGGVVLAFPAVLGGWMRSRAAFLLRELEQVKVRERADLARDLHDTVAHYVSAIAVQAQAGRAVAAKRPDDAVRALAAIEDAASRALDELRTLVRALRAGAPAELAPTPSLSALADLAKAAPPSHTVDVELAGALDDLGPTVTATLYRLAQESITNAVRHAVNARRIQIRVEGDGDVIRMTVTDDGERVRPRGAAPGFGLVGMKERATLLGGTLAAGPAGDRGWRVEAVLPRQGGHS